jgi:hypothetical protein
MKRLFLICLCFGVTVSGFALKKNNTSTKSSTTKKTFISNAAYHVGIMNAGITMPTRILNGTPHFGVEVGFSAPIKKDAAKPRFQVGADLGFIHQGGLQTGTYVKPNVSYKQPISKKINVQARVGVGAMVTKNLNNEFTIHPTTFEASKTSPYALQALPSIGIQPNFAIASGKKYNYEAYLRYEFAAQTPFSVISNILPITMMQMGVKVKSN